MTREDTIRILSVLRGAYPAFYRDITKQEAESTIALWWAMFDEEPYELVAAAVKAFIVADGKGYPPAIGQIKEWIRQLTQPEEMTEQEAWAIVNKALKNSTYNSVEEFEKLPEDIRVVVHDPSQLKQWAMADADETQTVIASNFMRSYRAKQKQKNDYLALPAEVKRRMLTAPYGHREGLMRLFGGEEDAGTS